MKIRNGFVSNSSSSSFLVSFAKVPETVEELQEMLFGNSQKYFSLWDDNKYWSTREVSEIVFRGLENGEPLTDKEIIKKLAEGIADHGPDYHDFPDPEGWGFDWDAYEKAVKEWSPDLIKELREKTNRTVFHFEYSDRDGELFSAMEHGDLFDRLPYVRISKH